MNRINVRQLKGVEAEVYSYFFQLGKKLKQEELDLILSDLKSDLRPGKQLMVLDHYEKKFGVCSEDYEINRYELAKIDDRGIIVGAKTGRKLKVVIQMNDKREEVARYHGTSAAGAAHSSAVGAGSTISNAVSTGVKRYGFYWSYDGEVE